MIIVNCAKDTWRHITPRAIQIYIQYYLSNINGERIPVCANVFSNVTSFTCRHLNILASRFKNEQTSSIKKKSRNEV